MTSLRKRWLLSLVAVAWPSIAHADSLKLEDAVKLALQNNERSQKAPLRLETAEGQLDRARDAFFPTLVGAGAGTYKPDPPAKTPNVTESGTLTLTQPLITPSAFPQYSQQKHNVEAERWGGIQDKRQLMFDTAKAFIQALTAQHVLDSAQKKAETAKTNVDTAQARAAAGLSSTNDVTKAQLQLSSSLGQVETAKGNVEKALIGLGFLIGQKVDGTLVPPDNTTTAAQRYEQSQKNQVKTALERHQDTISAAQERRPDLKSQHEKTEALRDSAKEPLYRLIPSLSASGQMRFVPDPLPSEKGVDESISLNLSWQIFDSGFRYADRRQRLSQLRSAELDEHLLGRTVGNDIDLALAALRAARASFKVADEAITSAQKNVEETQILYQQGLARAIEVNDANDQRFQAEVTRESAKLTMEQAYLDLRNALGFGPIDEGSAQ